MTSIKRYEYLNDKKITAQKADNLDNYLWVAFDKNTSNNCVIKKCGFGLPTQTYYTLTREVTKVNALDLDNTNLYVAYNDATYLGEIISKNNPLTVITPISRGAIIEAPVDVKIDNDDLWFLLPGNASGTNAQLLKYDRLGVAQTTVDLNKSGVFVTNAKSMVIKQDEDGGVASDVNTSLLLRCNGEDGSTIFTDSGVSGFTVNPVNQAQVDTAQWKYGGGSALFDGNADYLSAVTGSNMDFGTAPLTMDMWVRFATIAGNQSFITRSTSGSSYFYWGMESGEIRFRDYNGAEIINLSFGTPALSLNTWYHFAIIRSGNDFRFFVDGTQSGSTLTDSSSMVVRTADIQIGGSSVLSYYMNGWIDDARISKGTDRGWSGGFTPPIALGGDIWISTFTDPAQLIRVYEVSNNVYDFDATSII